MKLKEKIDPGYYHLNDILVKIEDGWDLGDAAGYNIEISDWLGKYTGPYTSLENGNRIITLSYGMLSKLNSASDYEVGLAENKELSRIIKKSLNTDSAFSVNLRYTKERRKMCSLFIEILNPIKILFNVEKDEK